MSKPKRCRVALGMVRCCRCPECGKCVSAEGDPPTLVIAEEGISLDSNAPLNWECDFCGYGQEPALWDTFLAVPTDNPLIADKREVLQKELFHA